MDAIETEDTENLIEELGDLLFQIVFHAQLGREEGLFTFNDVLRESTKNGAPPSPRFYGD